MGYDVYRDIRADYGSCPLCGEDFVADPMHYVRCKAMVVTRARNRGHGKANDTAAAFLRAGGHAVAVERTAIPDLAHAGTVPPRMLWPDMSAIIAMPDRPAAPYMEDTIIRDVSSSSYPPGQPLPPVGPTTIRSGEAQKRYKFERSVNAVGAVFIPIALNNCGGIGSAFLAHMDDAGAALSMTELARWRLRLSICAVRAVAQAQPIR